MGGLNDEISKVAFWDSKWLRQTRLILSAAGLSTFGTQKEWKRSEGRVIPVKRWAVAGTFISRAAIVFGPCPDVTRQEVAYFVAVLPVCALVLIHRLEALRSSHQGCSFTVPSILACFLSMTRIDLSPPLGTATTAHTSATLSCHIARLLSFHQLLPPFYPSLVLI